MPKRKALPKSLRFEVLKRDKFTCQYCGAQAPDVLLEVDHIVPVAEGGSDDILNLVTSCRNCNRGKGKRELSDDSVIKKSKKQADELQERKEQIEMLAEWQKSLCNLFNQQIEIIDSVIDEYYPGSTLNDNGKRNIKKLLENFTFDEVLRALKKALNFYDNAEEALSKIGGICYNCRKYKEHKVNLTIGDELFQYLDSKAKDYDMGIGAYILYELKLLMECEEVEKNGNVQNDIT